MSEIKYPRLSNAQIIELLKTTRLMHHMNPPATFDGVEHPMGHDLLLETIARLEHPSQSLQNSLSTLVKVDLNYVFTHNHDARTFIVDSIDNGLDHRKVSFTRDMDEVVEEIMEAIKQLNIAAMIAEFTYELYVGVNAVNSDNMDLRSVCAATPRQDWAIVKL